jgi:transposase
MIGRQDRWQEDLFVAGPLRNLVPEDHILKLVHTVLDLSWLREEVSESYCENNGRPSIDPESALRLMLAGFFEGIVHDRKLMRQAQVNLAIRWFSGYRLDEKLPDHSSLTRIRQRWGPELFRKIFEKTVAQCIEAGLVNGETVHVDATLIRADVSWESLVTTHADEVLTENADGKDDDPPGGGKPRKVKRVSRTDPDASMTTSRKDQRLEPSYKQHTAVDDLSGVIVDSEVTTGELSEGKQFLEQLARVEKTTGTHIRTVTADGSYAHAANYEALETRGTEAVIPPQRQPRTRSSMPLMRFKYDQRHALVRCPRGKILLRKGRVKNGWWYRAKSSECARCPLQERCVPGSAKSRSIMIVDGYESLLRARRKRRRWDDQTVAKYVRHRWRVEGVHGVSKTQHGLRRAARRGLWNVKIQSYLTAAVMNLKRLAALLYAFLARSQRHRNRMWRVSMRQDISSGIRTAQPTSLPRAA